MNLFFFHSIKGKLLLSLIILFAAAFTIQILYIAPKFEERKIAEIKISQNHMARYLADQISENLETAAREIEAMALLPAFVSPDEFSVNNTVMTINRSNHFFNYYFVLDPSGKWLAYPTQPELVGTYIPSENIDWVNKTVETGRIVSLDVMKSKIGSLVSGFSTPVKNTEGQIISILRGVFVISEKNALVKIITQANLLQNSQTYLVSSKGWLMAHSHQELNHETFQDYNMQRYPPVDRALKGQNGIITYEYDNQKWIASFFPIGITNWGLIVQQPLENVIAAAKKEARLIVLVVLGCFSVGLMVAAFWVQKSLIPLFKLVKDIQTGAFDEKTKYPRDEIGQLAFRYQKLFNELHQSRQRIQMSETKFKTLFNSANDAIYIVDQNGRFLEVNEKTIDLTQYSRDELLEMKLADISTPESDRMDQGTPSQTGDPVHRLIFETNHRNRSGKFIPVEISSSLIKYDNQNAVLRVARDLRERQRLEENLRQSQKMEAIGTLAGGIAHDFNNILSGIFGFSHLAKRHAGQPEKIEKDIDQIIKAAQKAAELVQQILTVSRRSIHENQPVAVYTVVKEALKLLRASIPANIEIKEDLISRAAVMADPGKIYQVIMNLCTNAYHAMSKTGGRLFVRLTEIGCSEDNQIPGQYTLPGKCLHLEVSDTGLGMDSGILKKIFDPYFTTKEPDKGTGLGLAVVFSIIDEYKGYIHVQSELGKGSAFHIYLPTIDKPAAPVVLKNKKKLLPTGKETIMIVDDEESLREVTHDILSGLGYMVHSFPNGDLAYEAFRKDPFKFDMVITDMTMPGISGLELAQRILQTRPEQPVILCTGYSESIDKAKAVSMGITEYIEKPFIVKHLAAIIRKVFDGSVI